MGINNKITKYQYIAIIHSCMIGVGILSLAQSVSSDAYQQGWISIIIGGIYPIIVVTTSIFIDRKMDHIDFWKINNQIYGKLLTYFITFGFFIVFIVFETSLIGGFCNVLYLTIINFIPRYIVVIVISFLTVYTTINGLTIVGRLCEMFFYLMIGFIALMLYFIPRGTIGNVSPFITNIKQIATAIPASLYSYIGVEIGYFIISYVTNKRNIKAAGLISVATVIFIYFFNVFITIYTLGWELTSKVTFPLLYLVTTVHMPIVENFTALLMLLWSSIIFKILPIHLYGASYCLSKLLNKGYKKCCIVSSILTAALSCFFIPEYNRAKILDLVVPYMVGYGVLWGVVTSAFVAFKTRKNSCSEVET